MSASPRHCRGFTLVEMLVALALFALLFLVIGDGLTLGLRALDRVEVAADRLEIRRSLDLALRRQIETMHPGGGGSAVQARIELDGEPDRLSFLSLGPPGAPGLSRLRLRLDGAGPDRRLVLERFPAIGIPSNPSETVILAGAVGRFALAYYGTLPPETGPRWHPVWRDAPALPELVRVTIALGDGGDPWPDLVVAPRARFAAR